MRPHIGTGHMWYTCGTNVVVQMPYVTVKAAGEVVSEGVWPSYVSMPYGRYPYRRGYRSRRFYPRARANYSRAVGGYRRRFYSRRWQ